jgi:hypothetical protein
MKFKELEDKVDSGILILSLRDRILNLENQVVEIKQENNAKNRQNKTERSDHLMARHHELNALAAKHYPF